ncbi:hypothetical protein HG531_011322 [Fusarium graminearum]|nr:hypothetical protein HG531_011322 [Fusarium graminearum]
MVNILKKQGAAFFNTLALKAVYADLAIFATTCHTAVAETNTSDGTSVASEAALTFSRTRLPDLGHGVISAGDNTESITNKAPNALHVAKHTADALAINSVPQANSVVKSASEHIAWGKGVGVVQAGHLIGLKIRRHQKNLLDLANMTKECLDALPGLDIPELDREIIGCRKDNTRGLNIPDLDGRIVRASRKDIIVKLEACHAIFMALKGLDRATACLPVVPHLEAIAVYILPWSKLALCFELLSRLASGVRSGALERSIAIFVFIVGGLALS